MLKRPGLAFAYLADTLKRIETALLALAARNPRDATILSDELHESVRSALVFSNNICEQFNLQQIIPLIRRIDKRLEKPVAPLILRNDVIHLQSEVLIVTEDLWSLMIDQSDIDLYNNPNLFGSKVTEKFASTNYDIKNAGNCLALGQPTASVFHLMRVVERGLKLLAEKLELGIDVEREDWAGIQRALHKRVPNLPRTTPEERKFSDDVASLLAPLHPMRIAWRNPTAHPHKAFTTEEARLIFDSTKHFMQHLVEVI
jgi:hypothetical protein